MKIGVVGTGYVGLVSGVCLAAKGHQVTCYDILAEKVAMINAAQPPIYENGLPELLNDVVSSGHLKAELFEPHQALNNELVLIAVGTPTTDEEIDLSQLREVSLSLGQALRTHSNFVSIVIKSTVVPGTTDSFVRPILEESSGKRVGEFGLGMNPEFLREGEAIEDFMSPDRVVLGSEDEETTKRLHAVYEPWSVPKLEVNTRTAELIKYANNALLATQISAINEIANIAAAVGGIDVMDVVEGVAADHRWSPRLSSGETVRPGILSYLIPGCGFGGSCFPKDVKALRSMADKVGVQPRVLQAVLDVNAAQPQQVTQLLKTQFDQLKDKSVLVLGLAFKPGTDDIRESVALRVIDDLTAEGSQIIAHDPIAHEHAQAELSENQSVTLVSDWVSYLDQVDAIIVTTLWDEYLTLSEDSLQQSIEGKIFIDCRRGFQPSQFKNSVYLAIGLTAAR